MESGLIFNQLICEFEPRHPCQSLKSSCRHLLLQMCQRNRSGRMLSVTTNQSRVTLVYLSPVYVGRSSTAEHRTVTAAREGSSPFDPPKFFSHGTVAEGLGA